MSQPDEARLATELGLLEAMYPEQIDYQARGRDFKFSEQSALLHLRIPESYPAAGLPDVISANDAAKKDLRDRTKAAVQRLGVGEGDEVLDAIIACFQGILETEGANADADADADAGGSEAGGSEAEAAAAGEANRTVIIWLHHLLALSKRKLALAPAPTVCGVTKPGYPGIMVFTGPGSAVRDHVDALKAENWQAFQVRYEDDSAWQLGHGEGAGGVREVETMAEVVQAVQDQTQREALLKAVGIK